MDFRSKHFDEEKEEEPIIVEENGKSTIEDDDDAEQNPRTKHAYHKHTSSKTNAESHDDSNNGDEN